MATKIISQSTNNKGFAYQNSISIPYLCTQFICWKSSCRLFYLLAAIFCFLPQILGYSLTIEWYPVQSLSDNQYYASLVASIAVTILLLIENTLDSIMTYMYVPKHRGTSDTLKYFEFPKELLLMILGKDLLLILYIIPNQAYDLLPGLLFGQDILFTWCYLYNLVRLGNPIWTLSKVFTIGFLFAITNIIASWITMSEEALNNPSLPIICQTMVALAFFIFFVVIGQWIHYVWKTVDESTDTMTYLTLIQVSVFVFFLLAYLTADWFTEFFLSYSFTVDWAPFGVSYLTLMVYMMTGCTAIVSIISGRANKLGTIIYSNANEILTVRKMFMRYISHEMRTPLNTVSVGLNVLIKQLQTTFKMASDHIIFMTTKDIQASCTVAVEILNDMLLYDKIESGHLVVELSSLSPWPLIKQSVELFYIQVSLQL